jgi:hypothetical protein
VTYCLWDLLPRFHFAGASSGAFATRGAQHAGADSPFRPCFSGLVCGRRPAGGLTGIDQLFRAQRPSIDNSSRPLACLLWTICGAGGTQAETKLGPRHKAGTLDAPRVSWLGPERLLGQAPREA